MSNRRKSRKPQVPEHDEHVFTTVAVRCVEHGNEHDFEMCPEVVPTVLAAMEAFHEHDCPSCGATDAMRIRPGKVWEGDPEWIWTCSAGCPAPVIRAALIRNGATEETLGDYAAEGRERTALYRMFGTQDELLYVGITKDFSQRWKQHESSKPWWPMVKRQTVDWYDSRTSALDAEEAAIKAEHPLHNIVHARSQVPAAFAKSPEA